MEKLEINEFLKSQMIKASKWAKFLAFFGYFYFGVNILAFLRMMADSPSEPLMIWLLIFVIMLIPCLYLHEFSKNLKNSVDSNISSKLDASFENLAKLFHFMGILVLVWVAFTLMYLL